MAIFRRRKTYTANVGGVRIGSDAPIAVQSMTKDTATVLVAVTTQVSNVASKQQEPRSWRLWVNLARDGGQLKLAKVEFVP